MKNFLSLICASVLGAVLTLGIVEYSGDSDRSMLSSNQSPTNTHTVSNRAAIASPAEKYDFVDASDKATKAVVHIYAEESKVLAQQRIQKQRSQRNNQRSNDPFGFFGFDDFFGGGGDIYGRGNNQPQSGMGSGVILSEDGYIVTNNHVVAHADVIVVTLNDGRKLKAEKIGTDPTTDLAVLKVEDTNLPILTYDDSDQVRVGEWVLAVGNPFDLASTVTAGIVSAKGRDLDLIKGDKSIEEFIQTDAAVNPGNSGGALVNDQGNLIGINTAIATPTGVYAGYSFAIPSNLVKRIVKDIIENGNIERANLGIWGQDVTEDLVTAMNLKIKDGIYIEKVDKGSAAQFAGILPGDVIIGVNNKDVYVFEDLVEEMKFAKVGDVLEIDIERDGRQKTLQVKLRRKI